MAKDKNTDKGKKGRLTLVTVLIGAVALIAVVAFIICINWIMSSAEKRGRESLAVFTQQTSLRLDDMLSQNSNILHQLKLDIGDGQTLEFGDIEKRLTEYKANWELTDIGALFDDDTAVGASGDTVEFATQIDIADWPVRAFGVAIEANTVAGMDVLMFAIETTNLPSDDISEGIPTVIDGKECVGYFLTLPISVINNMLDGTSYSNDKSTYIAVLDEEGDTVWRSNTDTGALDGSNIFEDLADARFEKKGDLTSMRLRLDMRQSGTVVYTIDGDKQALAYVSLKNIMWHMVIGLSYETIITQTANNLVTLVLIASIIVMASMCLTFYFVYRQRSADLRRQSAEMQAARAISETEAKSDFLSRMSHELRTPLNGIVGMIELAKRYGDDKVKREEYLDKIKDSSGYLVSLINDILDMAKIEHSKVVLAHEPFNMREMCQTVADIFYPMTEDKGLDFVMDCEGLAHSCFMGDEMRLKQVVVNLLSNAVKFTETGAVKCVVRELPYEDKMAVEIKVSDTGRGIGKEFIDRLFAPFEQENAPAQSNKAGTGLGLAICISLVKLAGGTITVDSVVGVGSVFTVTLPLEPSEIEIHSELKQDEANVGLDGINILLAEDNELNAEIATTLLTDSGARVERVENGLVACERFEESGVGEFDVILMDIQMPEMDGLQATKRIRASAHPNAKTVPIIAMTANALSEDREAALAAGMTDHLPKPIYIEKLCKVILQHCGKADGAAK